jgi:hypothetical protein
MESCLKNTKKKPDMVAQAYNPSTRELGKIRQEDSQPELDRETLSQKNRNKERGKGGRGHQESRTLTEARTASGENKECHK